jgi:acetylornithine deacetylase/succinyl-diaminopimelate desuccinylase-like protein
MLNVDWDAVAEEAVDLLRRFIRIDTTNPPGNEHLAAAFLEEVLRSEGIESQRYDAAPGRTNLVADLPAGTDAKPLILLPGRGGPVERIALRGHPP